MTNYTDIAELDQVAHELRVTWNKTMDYASSFATKFRAAAEQFTSGKYGPEWTFSRWLIVKCGMSERTCFRLIQQLERLASEEDRRHTRERLAEMRKQQAQEKTDLRARILAWNDWLLEERNRQRATQAAWDEWKVEERAQKDAERMKSTARKVEERAQKDAERARVRAEKEAKAAENHRQRSQRYRDRQTQARDAGFAENAENAKPTAIYVTEPDPLELAVRELVSLLRALPPLVAQSAIAQMIGWLKGFVQESDGEAA